MQRDNTQTFSFLHDSHLDDADVLVSMLHTPETIQDAFLEQQMRTRS